MRDRIVLLMKFALVLAMFAVVLEARPLFDWMSGRPDADTRLVNAIGSRDMPAIETALADGASVTSDTSVQMPPLGYAACIGNIPAVRRLLAEGANVNAPDWAGMTPLMWAASVDQVAMVDVLLRAGADPSCRDRNHRTALQMAMDRQADGAVKALSCNASDPMLAE